MRGNGDCGVGLTVMWNRHFDDELKRLTDMNGILEGPRCGACGTRYLVASPEEFIFNGANGKPGKKQGEKGKKPRTVGMKPGGVPGARSVRVIHAPCRSKPVARFTVSSEHRRQIEFPKEHWFNLVGKERDSRNSFDGIMTRETYTKAASLAVLKATLPRGKITLVGEHKSKMARVVPHIFHEEILADRFEWAVIGFDKDATIDTFEARQAAFKESIEAWKAAHPGMTAREALHNWTKANLSPAYGIASDGSRKPWPIVDFASSAFPRLWLRSPIQAASEIDKTVGFPVLPPRHREAIRRRSIDETIQDPELRAAITRRVGMATIQPASTFMNALRARLSIVERAGGRGSKNARARSTGQPTARVF